MFSLKTVKLKKKKTYKILALIFVSLFSPQSISPTAWSATVKFPSGDRKYPLYGKVGNKMNHKRGTSYN